MKAVELTDKELIRALEESSHGISDYIELNKELLERFKKTISLSRHAKPSVDKSRLSGVVPRAKISQDENISTQT